MKKARSSRKQPKSKKRILSFKQRLLPYLKKFSMDMLPIIVGVFIGLFLNTQREERQNRNLLDNTLQALSLEFEENSREIRGKLRRHTQIIDTLDFYMEDPNYNLYDLLVKAGGLASSEIYTTNWRATLNNCSLQLINFQTVKLLSRIENLHDDLTKEIDMLYLIIYGPSMYKRGEEGIEYRRNVLDLVRSYKADEEELLRHYTDFSDIVDNREYE